MNRYLKLLLATALVAVGLGLNWQPADAAGPIFSVTVSPDLNCQVNSGGNQLEACATVISYGGAKFGPAAVPGASLPNVTAFTPVSQATTGAGTAEDPFVITTVVNAGPYAQVTQVDTWVKGATNYSTTTSVKNITAVPKGINVWHAVDCAYDGNDSGFGRELLQGAIACNEAQNPTTKSVGLIELAPQTVGSGRLEGAATTVWSRVDNNDSFYGACTCDAYNDNAIGLSWFKNTAAGDTSSFTSVRSFSPEPYSANHAPVFNFAPSGPTPHEQGVGQNSEVKFNVEVTDPDFVPQDVTIQVTGDGVQAVSAPITTPLPKGAATSVVVTYKNAVAGDYPLSVVAQDAFGGVAETTITMHVTPNATTTTTEAPTTTTTVPAKAPTSIFAYGATLDTSGNLLTVSALLTTTGQAPVAGRTIAFTTSGGGAICIAVTAANGVASCSAIVSGLQGTLSLGYDATFAGGPTYFGSTGHGPIIRLGGLTLP